MNPQHCPSRIVCPVPRPRVYPPSGVKTRLECRDDQIVRRVDIDSVIEPSDIASESDGSIERLWVRDISEDPRHTLYIIGIRSVGDSKIHWLHPRLRLMNLDVLKQNHRWWRLLTEERPNSPVPRPAGPREHLFRADGEGDDPTPNPLPYTAKDNRCWCLEWTRIRRHASDHNHDVKYDSEAREADEGECNRGIDGPHVPAEAAGEKEEGNLEHHRETLDEEV